MLSTGETGIIAVMLSYVVHYTKCCFTCDLCAFVKYAVGNRELRTLR